MSLTGTYLRTIDEKQRLAVPKRLRDEMLGTSGAELYIAPEVDRSLSLFAPDLFADRAQRLVESSPGRANVRNYLRLYYSQAERVDVDSQGRIRIPERLVEFSSLRQEIVLLGVHDHLEIWDKSALATILRRTESGLRPTGWPGVSVGSIQYRYDQRKSAGYRACGLAAAMMSCQATIRPVPSTGRRSFASRSADTKPHEANDRRCLSANACHAHWHPLSGRQFTPKLIFRRPGRFR